MQFFFIQGCYELRNVDFEELSLMQLLAGMVLQLCQGVSKNWHIDIIKCFIDRLHHAINCPIENVIATFKELAKHRLAFWLVDKVDLPTQLFLRAKPKWLRLTMCGL
jgi:hypothetical protein